MSKFKAGDVVVITDRFKETHWPHKPAGEVFVVHEDVSGMEIQTPGGAIVCPAGTYTINYLDGSPVMAVFGGDYRQAFHGTYWFAKHPFATAVKEHAE